MGLIKLEGMEFFAYHGCFAEEQVIGSQFIVDLEVEAVTVEAEKSDELSKAVNYQTLYDLVAAEMKENSSLLEHVARRILDSVYKTCPNISAATVKIAKVNPPLGGKVQQVSVTLSR
jgi:7,8-dihydroneopterin aldolase/epimerase/oxygenase